MARALIRLVVLAGLALPCFAETRLDIPQARLAAARMIDAGQPQAAAEIANVLLYRDPSDISAHILQSHARRMLGDQSGAQAHARRAWRLSERPVDRYGSAIAMAQSLSTDGNKTFAQVWLRRAVQSAPTDGTRARAVRDYRYLRIANPWQVSLRSSFSPTDNVNNAPRDNTMEFGNLVLVNPTAVPLSGARATGGVTLRYNFNVAQTRRDFVAAFWDESRAFLSSSARASVPSARASDYDYRQYGFEIGRDFAPGRDLPRSSLALRATRSHFGGEPFSNELRLRVVRQHQFSGDRQLVWSAALARNEREDNPLRSATIGAVFAQWTMPLSAGGTLDWFGEIERQSSDSAVTAHDALTLGVNWTADQPVLGAEFSLGLSGEYRGFDQALYGPDPREDRSLSVSASFFFRNLDAYGFAPKLTVTADRTDSNITLFETEKVGLSVALQSVF